MSSNAISGVGVQFKREADDSSSAIPFVSLAEVNSIAGPTMSREFIDVTDLDSTGGYREFIASFRDAGTMVLTMNFTHSGYETLKADFEADALRAYQMVFPNTEATTFDFSGLVTEIPLDIPMDDKITCTCTIKISGQITMSS